MSIEIPVKLLHEAEGHIVSIEMKTRESFRGKLIEAEDNMNCRLEGVIQTQKDGSTARLNNVYLRGSSITYFVFPEMLRNAPMLKNLDKPTKGQGIGMGIGRQAQRQAKGMSYLFG
ncbi:putative Small nuclear ribonucleoprotein Sm D3 [Blattamonas nauphoetae]|uniref:Small nuclear ribonucleoprotein Sm D3 n=1 Tax=Blattamonas nauphoetae TaxID=2049346 RepID=A0ABQ9YH82_9EUKA|nr:putative Small nuclear ribonucleoprotein Sm D3 [Blattamonas nauphoetae]